jgi:hypothetical protein
MTDKLEHVAKHINRMDARSIEILVEVIEEDYYRIEGEIVTLMQTGLPGLTDAITKLRNRMNACSTAIQVLNAKREEILNAKTDELP